MYDPAQSASAIFGVKHAVAVHGRQRRRVGDRSLTDGLSAVLGDVSGRAVLYNGPNQTIDGAEYVNVTEYMLGLGRGTPLD